MKALVVEDQPAVAQALCVLLQMHDVPCLSVSSPAQALQVLEGEEIGLVIQDMNFTPGATSGREGIELFRRLRAHDPELPVLALTAWTSLETAVQMVKEGASDYLAKPWDDAKLLAAVRALLEMRDAAGGPALPPARARRCASSWRATTTCAISCTRARPCTASSRWRCRWRRADVPVLITGPNGVGKEKLAEIVQANSRRQDKPFLKVNAGALPDELLESELFGAEAGAFTGAVKRRVGRFEAADGGTLFLDEIGNLSPAGQAKLLRVLQSGEFERLGSSETRRVDVRVLAATNADLRDAMQQGLFRQDLFFRLNVIELAVPALADRPQDVIPLAERSLRLLAGPGAPGRRFSEAAHQALLAHDWPGNVRELMNRVQRATLVAGGARADARGPWPGQGAGGPGSLGGRTRCRRPAAHRAAPPRDGRQRVAGRRAPGPQPPGALPAHGEAGDQPGETAAGLASGPRERAAR